MLYRLHLLLLQEVFWGAATQLLKQHSICCTILQTHFLLMRNGFLSLVLESSHTLAAPSGKGYCLSPQGVAAPLGKGYCLSSQRAAAPSGKGSSLSPQGAAAPSGKGCSLSP